jgi:hypothetical protein
VGARKQQEGRRAADQELLFGHFRIISCLRAQFFGPTGQAAARAAVGIPGASTAQIAFGDCAFRNDLRQFLKIVRALESCGPEAGRDAPLGTIWRSHLM